MTEVTCKCGAVYRKGSEALRWRDNDTFNCQVCGVEMDSWNSSRVPTYELIRRPEEKAPDA